MLIPWFWILVGSSSQSSYYLNFQWRTSSLALVHLDNVRITKLFMFLTDIVVQRFRLSKLQVSPSQSRSPPMLLVLSLEFISACRLIYPSWTSSHVCARMDLQQPDTQLGYQFLNDCVAVFQLETEEPLQYAMQQGSEKMRRARSNGNT